MTLGVKVYEKTKNIEKVRWQSKKWNYEGKNITTGIEFTLLMIKTNWEANGLRNVSQAKSANDETVSIGLTVTFIILSKFASKPNLDS